MNVLCEMNRRPVTIVLMKCSKFANNNQAEHILSLIVDFIMLFRFKSATVLDLRFTY